MSQDLDGREAVPEPRGITSAEMRAIRQPLTSISMAAQLLLMEGLSREERSEMCGRILEQCRKLKQMLDHPGPGEKSA